MSEALIFREGLFPREASATSPMAVFQRSPCVPAIAHPVRTDPVLWSGIDKYPAEAVQRGGSKRPATACRTNDEMPSTIPFAGQRSALTQLTAGARTDGH